MNSSVKGSQTVSSISSNSADMFSAFSNITNPPLSTAWSNLPARKSPFISILPIRVENSVSPDTLNT